MSDTGKPLPQPKYEKFAQLRASGLSIQKAARAAGFSDGGHAIRLAQRPDIRARVEELQAPGAAKAKLTIETLFERLYQQAFYDPAVFADIRNPQELAELVDEDVRRMLVKGWRWDKQGRFLLSLVDKEVAINRLARHLAFYNDTIKVDMGDFAVKLARAKQQLGMPSAAPERPGESTRH